MYTKVIGKGELDNETIKLFIDGALARRRAPLDLEVIVFNRGSSLEIKATRGKMRYILLPINLMRDSATDTAKKIDGFCHKISGWDARNVDQILEGL